MAKKNENSKVMICGEVTNLSVVEFENGGCALDFAIMDTQRGNLCNCKMFFQKGWKAYYGKDTYEPKKLKQIFMNQNGESRGVKVLGRGTVYEDKYTDKQTGDIKKVNRILLTYIRPLPNNLEERIIFDLKGIIEKVNYNDDDTRIDLRVGFIDKQWDKDLQAEKNIIRHLNIFATDSVLNELNELDVDDDQYIEVKGFILNMRPKEVDIFDDPFDSIGQRGLKIEKLVKLEDDDEYLEKYEDIKSGKSLKTHEDDDNLDDIGF